MQCTPSLARMLVNHPVSREAIGQLKTMLVGGEALPPQLAHDLLDTGAGEIWNMYGPTETTIWSTMDKLQKDAARISIGRPIANTKLFILDENRRLVPMGVAGELYIGGEGVARGYLNRPELTAERFVEVAMGDRIERLYRTGDLVRYLPDSRVEFLGRMV
jgi:non-ribosomal peptide synthetase component F